MQYFVACKQFLKYQVKMNRKQKQARFSVRDLPRFLLALFSVSACVCRGISDCGGYVHPLTDDILHMDHCSEGSKVN